MMTVDPPGDRGPFTAGLIDFVFGEVWSRPGLSRRDRRFVTLACVAAADAQAPLEQHVYAALNSGDLTITEMRETVLHFAVYAGWPKASRFNIAVDQEWARIAEERGEAPLPRNRCCRWSPPATPSSGCRAAKHRSRRSTACRSRRCATTPTRARAF
ncbi:carboxymuconolactone decarboxylase family protein [Mycobacterium intracellulare]|nr:carboxymuconolactone decarboxylase family protein [Mycobacterium intracellulare]